MITVNNLFVGLFLRKKFMSNSQSRACIMITRTQFFCPAFSVSVGHQPLRWLPVPTVDLCGSASSGSRTVKYLVIILLWSLVI